MFVGVPQGTQQLVVAQHVEQPQDGRFGRLDPQALSDQPFVFVVIETASMGKLPFNGNELASQAAMMVSPSSRPDREIYGAPPPR